MNQEELNETVRLHGLWLRREEGGVRADLSNADLSNADLSNANLSNANLGNAYLKYANLSNANLKYANLGNTDLSNANLGNADLSNANLGNADLSNAYLDNADLSGAIGAPPYYSISWGGHGERGRRLHAVQVRGVLRFSCGCFEGTESDLRKYIEDGNEEYAESRLQALQTILALCEFDENNAPSNICNTGTA